MRRCPLCVTMSRHEVAGVLKAKWCYKHARQIPSVVVLFIDCPSDANWKNAENAIANQIESLRWVPAAGGLGIDKSRHRRRRHCRMAIAVVDSSSSGRGDLEEKTALIRKR